MSKKKQEFAFVPPTIKITTCREAHQLCRNVGVRVFWRPNGVINWMLPELDVAQILED